MGYCFIGYRYSVNLVIEWFIWCSCKCSNIVDSCTGFSSAVFGTVFAWTSTTETLTLVGRRGRLLTFSLPLCCFLSYLLMVKSMLRNVLIAPTHLTFRTCPHLSVFNTFWDADLLFIVWGTDEYEQRWELDGCRILLSMTRLLGLSLITNGDRVRCFGPDKIDRTLPGLFQLMKCNKYYLFNIILSYTINSTKLRWNSSIVLSSNSFIYLIKSSPG